MDEWVKRALAKWPDVPALYGWLRLTRRGRWLIKGELITNPKIVRVINRNYDCDDQGRWFFQNGPQRGYIALDYAPFTLRNMAEDITNEVLQTHNELQVSSATAAYLDEEGSFVLATQHGPGLISDDDLDWVLSRLQQDGSAVSEDQLATALVVASGGETQLQLHAFDQVLPVTRCDASEIPKVLGFAREPQEQFSL